MALAPGNYLGPFEILGPLGSGGMGEVFRARDTKLGRDVALKVLPEAFASQADRLSRFKREAQVLAALNHANIAGIFGLEESGSTTALVLELVEGATLADRLRNGPIPLDEALPIARQIAQALEAAHDRGIMHRDLKPANIKVTAEGKVKVLDFGLAKILGDDAANASMSQSPTMISAVSAPGVILGTAAYMSPEQARGKTVDKRTDIWAFGVVLFEMLTGRPLFTGDSVTDVLAAVVRSAPDLGLLPGSVPPSILRLLKRCLEKDRENRLPDIGVARLEIDEARMPGAAAPAPAAGRRTRMPWIVAAFAVLAAAAWVVFRPQPASPHWIGTRLSESTAAIIPKLSPDGKLLAFAAIVDGQTQAAVMKPETGNWTVLTHERSRGLITALDWSPDGAKLYFDRFYDAPRGIYSIPVLGGDEQLILEDAMTPQRLTDGSFLVNRLNADRLPQLYRFWPETGRIQPLRALLETTYQSVTFRATPDGNRVVFFGKPLDQPASANQLYVLDLKSEKITRLAPDVYFGTREFFPIAVSNDGRSALIDLPVDDTHRIVSLPLDGSRKLSVLMTLTNQVSTIDAAADGYIYLDQWDRPTEILRLSSKGSAPERLATISWNSNLNIVLPLSDDRLLFTSRTLGRNRVVLIAKGKEPTAFVETQEETTGPLTLVGQTEAAFLIGSQSSRTIAIASLADRRIIRKLEGPKGAEINSMVSSPDSRTIYYAADGSIWRVPVNDGKPEKIRTGDSVTMDPYAHQLVLRITDKDGTRLVRAPLDGGHDQPIALQKDVRLAPFFLSSNAVGRDGRIMAQQAPPSSWFWSLGIIDPRSGQAPLLQVGYDADMTGGWASDGTLVIVSQALHATLWRFRPEASSPK